MLKHIYETQDGRNTLGNQGCVSGTGSSARNNHNEEEIKYDVQQGGENQKKQRSFTVSDAAKNSGRNIVSHTEEDACKNNLNVTIGHIQKLRRGLHHYKKRLGIDDRWDGKNH